MNLDPTLLTWIFFVGGLLLMLLETLVPGGVARLGAQQPNGDTLIARPEWLARLAGTPRLQTMLENGAQPAAIIQAWADEVEAFRARRQAYLLYGVDG